MKKQRLLNNKGFSLVELIIVIAIMAILVGVLAPSLLRYVEKTNVSADTQLADTVRTAVVTAMMDPAVINTAEADGTYSADTFSTGHATLTAISSATTKGEFLKALNVTMGFDDTVVTNGDELQKALFAKLKSTKGTNCAIQVLVTKGNAVKVVISDTDNTGGKTPAAAKYITVE